MKNTWKPLNLNKWTAVALSIALVIALGFVSIFLLGEYGWTVFVLIPILLGFLPVYLYGKNKKIKWREASSLGFLTISITAFCLVLFAIEGLICIAMAFPLAAIMTWGGSYLGYLAVKRDNLQSKRILSILAISALGTMSFDTLNKPQELIPVRTKIIIDAPIEKVWENVVTFNKIGEPRDWIFKTGVAYPTHATIKGKGVGAIRYCNFTTGSFVEPITVWDEPNRLAFDVLDQPAPMSEFNPFWDIHPKHLDGYFRSYKGQFKLTKLGNNKTELEGTTWFKVDITPEFYWSAWSEYIIHKIHLRVLEHIRKTSKKG